jgi:hypothetical protein
MGAKLNWLRIGPVTGCSISEISSSGHYNVIIVIERGKMIIRCTITDIF